jgi:O-antigen ligase
VSAALALPELPKKVADVRPIHFALNDIIAYGVAALVLFSPLAFGAVEPWAIFVLETVSALLFGLWVFSQMRSTRITVLQSPIFRPMLVFGALILLQMLFGLTAYGHATSAAFFLYVAYALICFLLTQTFTRTRHLQRTATVVVIYGTAMAMFAVLQSLSSPGKIYWFRTQQVGGWIYGPYVNHNHYAGLMEMLVPLPLVFAFSRHARGRERWATASAAALMGASIFLSGSRGGMAAFAVQLGVLLYFLFRERRGESTGFLLGGFLLISIATVAWIGGNQVSSRIATLDGDRRAELNSDIRLRIDRDTLTMLAKRPILGWGLGSFEYVYPRFRSFYTSQFVDKAHNDYLQLAAETGLLGLCAGVWFLCVTLRCAWGKAHKWATDINGAVSVAVLVGVVGILVHSLVDFNLQIPANAALFYSLCTFAAMGPRFSSHRRGHNHAHQ